MSSAGPVDTETPALYSAADLRARARRRLSLDLAADALDPAAPAVWGDHQLDPDAVSAVLRPTGLPAAVLVPVVARPDEATVLLTQRASTLRQHSGQIAFPGGKIEADDGSPLDAALRETREEIGLAARHIEPVGYLDAYVTGTGFRIWPVLAIVEPPFEIAINPAEVDDIFEVPVRFLMDPANHLRHVREISGRERQFYAMPYQDHYIWGATAGMLRNLYIRLYSA